MKLSDEISWLDKIKRNESDYYRIIYNGNYLPTALVYRELPNEIYISNNAGSAERLATVQNLINQQIITVQEAHRIMDLPMVIPNLHYAPNPWGPDDETEEE